MKFDSTNPDEYQGVSVNMKVTPQSATPVYVIRFGNLTVEIDETTAVRLGDDLLDKVSRVNDPDSEFNKCQCNCFECSLDSHDICRHVIKCIKRPKVGP